MESCEFFIDCMAKFVFSPEMKPRLLESKASFFALVVAFLTETRFLQILRGLKGIHQPCDWFL